MFVDWGSAIFTTDALILIRRDQSPGYVIYASVFLSAIVSQYITVSAALICNKFKLLSIGSVTDLLTFLCSGILVRDVNTLEVVHLL